MQGLLWKEDVRRKKILGSRLLLDGGEMNGAVTNPQSIRVKNRRAEQSKWRSHKRWKQLVADHAHVPGAVCVHCLRKHREPIVDKNGKQRCDKNGKPRFVYLTINHKSRAKYWSEDLYCTWDETDMEICCNDCNKNIEIGLKRCPICHRTYIGWQDYCCQPCWDERHPEEAQNRMASVAQKKEEKKALLKKLRDDEKRKVKEWKAAHPKTPKCLSEHQTSKSRQTLKLQ